MTHKNGLSKRQIRAAQLVADDDCTDDTIAADVGVSRKTLALWKQRPTFAARVQAIRDTYEETLAAEGIANKQNRVAALQDTFDRLEQVTAERAADPTMEGIPGGSTGLVLRQYKQIGAGRDAQLIEEHVVDVPALRERRATLQQAAQELGQWKDAIEHSGEVVFTIHVDRTDRSAAES